MNFDEISTEQQVLLIKEGLNADSCYISEPQEMDGTLYAQVLSDPKQEFGVKRYDYIEVEIIECKEPEEDEEFEFIEVEEGLEGEIANEILYYCDLDKFDVIERYYLYHQADLEEALVAYNADKTTNNYSKILNTLKERDIWIVCTKVEDDENVLISDIYKTLSIVDEPQVAVFTYAHGFYEPDEEVNKDNMLQISIKELLNIVLENDPDEDLSLVINPFTDNVTVSRRLWKYLLDDKEITINKDENVEDEVYRSAVLSTETNIGYETSNHWLDVLTSMTFWISETYGIYYMLDENKQVTYIPIFSNDKEKVLFDKDKKYIKKNIYEIIGIAKNSTNYVDCIYINPFTDLEEKIYRDMWDIIIEQSEVDDDELN